MSNIREAVAKYIKGKWYSEKAKLKIHISEVTKSWIYLFKYDGGYDDNLKGEDITEITYDSEGNVISSNRSGKWRIKFISPDRIQFESRNDKDYQTLEFQREN